MIFAICHICAITFPHIVIKKTFKSAMFPLKCVFCSLYSIYTVFLGDSVLSAINLQRCHRLHRKPVQYIYVPQQTC